ncbi:hypothetical protein B0H14DRAFT_442914 [Mycena olivaceomarginata]|nr:hypothetical protein B0H14DRAFT_442914 [Mycena olivaceomarginata]
MPCMDQHRAISCTHILGNNNTYPPWILTYWAELRTLWESRKCWEGAIHALEEQIQQNNFESSVRIAEQTLDRVFALPWYSGLRGFDESDVEGLVNLCKPTVWLKTTEMNQMLEILDDNEMLQIRGIRVFL